MTKSKEFKFTNKDFNYIRELVLAKTGINLSEGKSDMVYSRLTRRLRTLNLNQFAEYLNLLKNEDEGELVHFVNAITTNLTSFYRENHHFEYLSKTLLPKLMKKKSDRRLRIWSAGCSTGEEPYSIAMVISEIMGKTRNWDIKILATDLDSNVVDMASNGIYMQNKLTGVSDKRLKRFFKINNSSGEVKAGQEIRDQITFKQLNLMHEWPFKGPFDFIFCRNVVIYFNKDTQRELFDRYANYTVDGGHLFIGHSESLFKVCDRYKLLGNTIYRKVE